MEKDQKVMKNIFKNFDYSHFKDIDFPKEGSIEFEDEIDLLNDLPFNESFVIYNDDIIECFKDLFDREGITFPEKTIKTLIDNSRPIIVDLKNYHNRPRPWNYTENKNVLKLGSMTTPAFPSGHSTQAELISRFLSKYYPNLQNQLNKISKNVSASRNIARAHYPSDTNVGRLLGKEMSNFLTQS
jgi:hypothetical protein